MDLQWSCMYNDLIDFLLYVSVVQYVHFKNGLMYGSSWEEICNITQEPQELQICNYTIVGSSASLLW